MKKIINSKKYDTKTASLMAQDYADCAVNDFNYWWEGLYQKKTGEFFLYGKGQALSKYASHYGNCSDEGEKLIPLTIEEAKRWCERHASHEYEEIFGEVEE